jgi:transposase-like protein
MALDQSALLDLLAQLKLSDRIRSETLCQELIDADATAFIGPSPFERSAERTTQRNGTRPRTLTESPWVSFLLLSVCSGR